MKYKIWYQKNNKIVSKNIDNLDSLPPNIIKIKPLYKDKTILFKSNKSDLIACFYEISMMLDAKLQLADAIDILLQSNNTNVIQEMLLKIEYSLKSGQSISDSLKSMENKIGYLPILFFKLGEKSNKMDIAISALHKILLEEYNIKQKILKALKYPLVLFISIVVSLIIIFLFVVPKFEYIFNQFGSSLPLSTQLLLFIKNSISFYYLELLLFFLIAITLFLYCIKKYKYLFDKFLIVYIPYFSNFYKKVIFYKLFLSLYFIVSTKNQFQQALLQTQSISKNLYIKEKLKQIVEDIENGINISQAFSNTNLFDTTTIRLLEVAQKTNRLETILKDIKNIYYKQFNKSLDNFITIIEPLLVLFIATIILWIVVAIMSPIWEMGNIIR